MAETLAETPVRTQEQNREQDLFNQITDLGHSLGNHQIDSFRFACKGLGFLQNQIDNKTFGELYCLIETINRQQAPSIVYAILRRLDYLETELDRRANILSEAHNKEPYDTRQNQLLDLHLSLADVVRNMSDNNYNRFRRRVCASFLDSYHPDTIESRCHLMQLVLDKEDPPNFSRILGCLEVLQFLLHQMPIFEYCNRHGLQRPVPDTSNIEESDIYEDVTLQEKKLCHCDFCNCDHKCKCLTFLLFIMFLIFIGISAGVFVIQKPRYTNPISNSSNYTYGGSTTVFISHFSSYNTKRITIATNYALDIHKVVSSPNNNTYLNILPYKTLTPPNHLYHNDKTVFMNYFEDNNPIYTANDGYITYSIRLVTFNVNSTCPLRVVGFNSHSPFHRFLFSPHSSKVPPDAYTNTTCLHGNTTQSHTFFLKNNSFYFFAVSHEANVSFEIYAWGEISKYYSNITNTPVRCNPGKVLCSIEISNYDFQGFDKQEWYLYASSNITSQDEFILHEIQVKWCILGMVLFVIALIIVIIKIIMFIVCLRFCCKPCTNRNIGVGNRYVLVPTNQVPDSSKTSSETSSVTSSETS